MLPSPLLLQGQTQPVAAEAPKLLPNVDTTWRHLMQAMQPPSGPPPPQALLEEGLRLMVQLTSLAGSDDAPPCVHLSVCLFLVSMA